MEMNSFSITRDMLLDLLGYMVTYEILALFVLSDCLHYE